MDGPLRVHGPLVLILRQLPPPTRPERGPGPHGRERRLVRERRHLPRHLPGLGQLARRPHGRSQGARTLCRRAA